jgi:hypothetical protein
MGVKVALAEGLALIGIAIALTLLGSPISVARTNGVPQDQATLAIAQRGAGYCQAHELLPPDTSAIRLALSATSGPRVRVSVSSAGRAVTDGVRDAGWTTRGVTVAVTPVPHAVPEATVCVSFPANNETVALYGEATSPAVAASAGRRALAGRFWIEYLRPGKRSWASLVPSIAARIGLGRAAGGSTWIVFVALALIAAVAVLASSLLIGELR